LYIGESASSLNFGRRFHLNDSVTWQKSTHRVRFGGEWEHYRGDVLTNLNDPATLVLFSPDEVRAYNTSPKTPANLQVALPTAFRTVDDILRLPLKSVTIGVGDPRVPQENGSTTRIWNESRLFVQDTWRVREGLTLNYGIAWNMDDPLNYDLNKPALLAPLLGADGLGPTRKQWKNFSPVAGLAWSPSRGGKTVIRAGAGIYYDFLVGANLDLERAALERPGVGRLYYSGTQIMNTIPGVPNAAVGTALNFNSPTAFNGADFMAMLPGIQSDKARSAANSDPSLTAIQVNKSLTGQLGALYPENFPNSSGQHASAGVQREIARDFVVSADFAYRHFIHLGTGANGVDLNHYNAAIGPAIKMCNSSQRNDPLALCSLGQINVQEPAARATYRGLLVRAEKRFSHGFQMLASYALSREAGTGNGNGFDLFHWSNNVGSSNNDYTHVLNLSGVARLPWRFELGLNFSYQNAPPFSAFVGGIDFNGDGTTNDLLPGTTLNAFNRGMGQADLVRLVDQFNQTKAGTLDGGNRPIKALTLPSNYSFGDGIHSLDLRLSRSFPVGERARVWLIGEVFNLYNAANRTGFSGDLTSAAFGQPTGRSTQIFGSSGPRAFQLAVKVTF
jgi:hypothetical protein